MADVDLQREIDAAINNGHDFGPAELDDGLPEIPATILREILRSRSDEEGENRLCLRHQRIVGSLDMEAQKVGVRLIFEQCEFDGLVSFSQATAIDLRFTECTFRASFSGIQMTVEHNLYFPFLSTSAPLFLAGAEIGGVLSLADATIRPAPTLEADSPPALNATGIRIGGNLVADRLVSAGEISLRGALIEGQLLLPQTSLNRDEDGNAFAPVALSADGSEIRRGLICSEMQAAGELRFPGAKIGGQLTMEKATLKRASTGPTQPALMADRLTVTQSAFLEDVSVTGEVRLLNAEIIGNLSFDGTEIDGSTEGEGEWRSLSADGLRVHSDVFCREGFSTKGEARFVGANITGSLWMDGAKMAAEGRANSCALNIERGRIGEGLLGNGIRSEGEVRLHSTRVGGFMTFREASFEGSRNDDESFGRAFGALRMVVAGTASCNETTVRGEMDWTGAVIEGQLSLIKTNLASSSNRPCLSLVAAKIDELVIALAAVEGSVDLRDASLRSLWDADKGEFAGELPDKMRLEGFTYLSMREPLDAARRLDWISRSQTERHYPEVYTELANGFKRAGRLGDARAVSIANERRARQMCRKLSPRRLWHDMLWVTVGYGYRNWLAAIWLLALIFAGAILFAVDSTSFVATTRHHPDLDPILYSIDVTVPILDLGQTRSWSATGVDAWAGLVLAVSGYGLAAAVLAAAAGLFGRDQR